MPQTNFREQIKEQLRPLNREQICHFAWLCAVRALPFLSTGRAFFYWQENDRLKHLCSIFYALDVSAGRSLKIPQNNDYIDRATDRAVAVAAAKITTDAVIRAAAAADSADSAFRAISAAYDATDDAFRAIAAAASAATYDDFKVLADDYTFGAAVNTTSYAAAAAAYAVDTDKALEKTLYDDIRAIKNNNLTALDNDTSIYGEIWPHFLEDLNIIGCAYWAQLYENLFKSGFVIDKKELERRLNVPDEIKERGAAAVGQYIERLGHDTEALNEARIIILGEKGAGKTSIARKLIDIDADLPREDESTEGVITNVWSFPDKDDNKIVNAHIWDFAGHSITHSAHRCFMSARCLYIYVYNGRIGRDNDPSYWLEQIRIHGGDSPVLFLVNEKDAHRADIAEKTLKIDYPSIAGYYRVDICNENKTKLEEFRQIVMKMVRDNPAWNSQVVSAEAYKIKNTLRERFDKEKSPHISREEFDAIALKNGVSKEHLNDILADLHTLGICLWYDKPEMAEYRTLVLNPNWITNGIYRLINRGFSERRHKLSVIDGAKMLQNDERYEYPNDKVEYLFRLMRLYELAFFKDDENVFIPGILPLDQPNDLPTFNNANDRLTMVFAVEKNLPPNIAARIIVQRNEFNEIFDEKLLWRKGAVLKYRKGDATALIVETERNISVRIKGTDKTAYLATLRETLKNIFESYKTIKPNLLYEVLMPEEYEEIKLLNPLENKTPIMLPERVISGYLRAGRSFFDPENEIDISLNKTGREYAIVNFFFAPVLIQNNNHSIRVTYNTDLRDRVVNLQGELNGLAVDLRAKNFIDDADYVETIATAIENMQQVIDSTPQKSKFDETLIKKGLVSQIKEFCDELTDENSELNKKVAKLRNGTKKLQKIGKIYNDFARVTPSLPQAPEAMLALIKGDMDENE